MSSPFLSVDYSTRGTREDPIVTLKLTIGGREHSIDAYADTGCDAPLAIPKQMAEKLGLEEEDAISEHEEVILADGTIIGVLLYKVNAKIGLQERSVIIQVMDPDMKLGKSTHPLADEPLLGRGIMDLHNVLFEGKSVPKKLKFHE